MSTATVKTDCCGNVEEYLIANSFGGGRVRVQGTCPICSAEESLGTIEAAETKETTMTRHEAIAQLAATLDIERRDAADLIDEYALNAGEVRNVSEIVDVSAGRVQEIIGDQREEAKERVNALNGQPLSVENWKR